MKKVTTTFSLSYILSFLLLTLAFPTMAFAQTKAWSVGTCTGSSVYGAEDVATIQGIECLVGNVLSIIITIIGIAAFVMFIIGSFRYLTSGSNSKGVESGKNAITFAIIGIVVALASYIILRFVSQFTGATTFLQFNTQLPK